ncbi:UPF0235 protein [Vairimorpha necatrix]|uniref:UPF0235 protein n=1 Tax=Vairimorpha necatrix TaxID=6039 RepID=A0AAX4JAZ9_9MICR
MVKLSITVVPNSQTTQIKSIEEKEIRILINQPPEKDKANIELCKYLSRVLKIPRSEISIISGHTSRHKVVSVQIEEDCIDLLKKEIEN